MKIATWNVNSIKVRLTQVLQWLESDSPDILALQELKMTSEAFPFAEFKQKGYHVIANGQKTYNGVAILSKYPLEDVVTDIPSLMDPQRRILCATTNGVRVLNLYVPNGESITSDKYQYKLDWLNYVKNYIKQEAATNSKMVILGDFNIAPEDADVYDPIFWSGRVLFSEPERLAFKDILTFGFKDCFRMHPQPDKSYSWWDYRLNAFKRQMGLRIDHILVSEGYAAQNIRCYIDKGPRAWDRPSDHAPVVAEFTP